MTVPITEVLADALHGFIFMVCLQVQAFKSHTFLMGLPIRALPLRLAAG